MSQTLYNKKNYIINAKFLKSVRITEYDISKANISILYSSNLISQEQYHYLLYLPKIDREIYIGKMIAESEGKLGKIIDNGIVEYKRQLFLSNNIQDEEVIRIANDSVYVMRSLPLKYTDFGIVKFNLKNTYSMFARLGSLTFFYSSNFNGIDLDVKGLGEYQTLLHLDYMLNFIGNLFYLIDSTNLKEAMGYYTDFYNDYINRRLDIRYYRELNPDSLYTIIGKNNNNGRYGISECSNEYIDGIDIGYNAQILRELFGILANIHETRY